MHLAITHRDKIQVGEDVDENYLLEVWNQQEGICPYTGVKLELKKHRNRGEKIPYQASVDRIDSSKGYVRGNIEFVSLIANYAKNSWDRQTVLDFIKTAHKYQEKKWQTERRILNLSKRVG